MDDGWSTRMWPGTSGRRRLRTLTLTGVVAAVGLGGVAATPSGAAEVAPTHRTGKAVVLPVVPGLGTHWGDDETHEGAKATKAGTWNPAADLGSMLSLTSHSGVRRAWAQGATGRGVTVAVIDTGIAPVKGLEARGKVVNGPDLSYDSQRKGTRSVDGYGHGTHMAGIIAGRDSGFKAAKPDARLFAGVAPDAQLLNMKVAAGDGGADVTEVIAALDWVVQHRTDHGMNVRVVNLSYGTHSLQSWQVDPLARAVESAWEHGIVVVAAAGNDGLAASSLLMPAVDPTVVAVGAVDHRGTATSADDVVADFTTGGNDGRRPDVLAPGKSVVSLRVPASFVDRTHPEGLVGGDKAHRFFRGSGTSQATAVVSGEVALLLSARPSLTPDQVKALLRGTADPLTASPQPAMGAGVVDVTRALAAETSAPGPSADPGRSSGLGTLEASRGGENVVDPATGSVLHGEVDALGSPWQAQAWATASAAGRAWRAGDWNGRTWAGSGWHGDTWRPGAWTGLAWDGTAWQTHPWSRMVWNTRSWRDVGFAARSWRDSGWLARSWRADSWHARSWRGVG